MNLVYMVLEKNIVRKFKVCILSKLCFDTKHLKSDLCKNNEFGLMHSMPLSYFTSKFNLLEIAILFI